MPGRETRTMSRYERRIFFDRLCQLRETYEARGDDDAVGSHTIDDVVRDVYLAIEAFETEIHLGEAPEGTVVGEEPSR
jgi:hypothetical protein